MLEIKNSQIINNNINNTNINKQRNNNKGIFALGFNPDSATALNILKEQNKAKEAYQNYRNYLREGKADNKYKSSPFPIEQFSLNNIDENKFIEEQKPLNVINYIAKKLVSSSFCGSFNLQYPSTQKYSTARRGSSLTYNHFISNGNLYANKESNPINEEIEYIKDNNDGEVNGSNNKNNNRNNGIEDNNIKNNDNIEDNNEENDDYSNDNKNDINFKNLISILNQKFKKYINQEDSEIEEIDNKNNVNNGKYSYNNKNNNLNINQSKNKNKNISNNKNDNLYLYDTSKNKYSKKIEYEDDSYSNPFGGNKKYKNDLVMPTNNEIYTYNINDMTSHYNKFLDISTNYDPGIDSRGGSIERTDSINKNDLRNFSYSLDKNHKKRGEHKFKTEYNENNNGNNYNIIKNTFSGSQNKFIKNENIISENDEFTKNKIVIKNNKDFKNKHSPFCDKKVSINLTANFNNLNKNEYKQKKNKY